MSNQRSSLEFKERAVRQIVDRGYSVAEYSNRLGASARRLCRGGKAGVLHKTDDRVATPSMSLPILWGTAYRFGKMLPPPARVEITIRIELFCPYFTQLDFVDISLVGEWVLLHNLSK